LPIINTLTLFCRILLARNPLQHLFHDRSGDLPAYSTKSHHTLIVSSCFPPRFYKYIKANLEFLIRSRDIRILLRCSVWQ
jgi:hypothetical protein